MFPYTKLAIGALVVLLGVPSVALGGSFASSLIQGKTPAEAVEVIAEQVDVLFGRVQELETEQAKSAEDIELLKEENERLRGAIDGKADVEIDRTKTPECLALQAKINAAESLNETALEVLYKEMQELRKQLAEVKRGEFSASANSDDLSAWQEGLAEISERKEALEDEMEELSDKIDVLEEESQNAAKAPLEEARSKWCVKG